MHKGVGERVHVLLLHGAVQKVNHDVLLDDLLDLVSAISHLLDGLRDGILAALDELVDGLSLLGVLVFNSSYDVEEQL